MNKTIVLGPEYDEALQLRLGKVLKRLGATKRAHDWGVGGSQEIETTTVQVEGYMIVVESETYIGLSVSGEASLVDRIALLVAE